MPSLDEIRKFNAQSAKDNKWGVLPGGDYMAPDDPQLVQDANALKYRLSLPTVGLYSGTNDGRVDKALVELLREKMADVTKAVKDPPDLLAQRFLSTIDLNPGTTRTINLAIAGASVAGVVGDRVLDPKPKQLVK